MNNELTLYISAFLLLTSTYLFPSSSSRLINKLCFLCIVFFSILLLIGYLVLNYFTGEGINEAVIYQLKYGFAGAGFSEYKKLMITTFISIVVIAFTVYKLFNKTHKKSRPRKELAYTLLSLSLFSNPAVYDLVKIQLNNSFSITHSESFNLHYSTPTKLDKIPNKEQKNLVFIYAESLERTYFNELTFPDLIKGLKSIESQSTSFTNIVQATATNWTVAGMTASQCGIPLFSPSSRNTMNGADKFLPLATCLGDLLKKEGYDLNYIGGAKTNFAGKGKLYKTHGFSSVKGKDELVPELENPNYKHGWGLYDDSTLDIAYENFISLSKKNKKFGLFTLTLDTHPPKGHPSKSCKDIKYNDGSNPILNAVACSDFLITKFIQKIQTSPHADSTVIILMSDHFSMENTASELLNENKKARKNLFLILDPSNIKPTKIPTLGSTLDVSSTILPFIGYSAEIGLGQNLLSAESNNKKTSFILNNLNNWRSNIIDLWGFPTIESPITFSLNDQTIELEGRNFTAPVLIEFNSQMKTVLRFGFNTPPNNQLNRLIKHLPLMDEGDYFLLFQQCKKISVLDERIGQDGFCLISGNGQNLNKAKIIESDLTLTKQDIQQLFNLPLKQ